MSQENLFLFHAFCLGFFISFFYDLLRIYRRLFPHGLFWVSVEDLFFWIYCATEVFLLMHREGNGNLRWFAVLGAMAGMGVYVKFISPFLLKTALKILGPVVRALRKWRKAVKKKLTSLCGLIKMRIRKCRIKKRGAADGDEQKSPKKTRLGGKFQKPPKGAKKHSQAP